MSGYGKHLEDATKQVPRSTMYRRAKEKRNFDENITSNSSDDRGRLRESSIFEDNDSSSRQSYQSNDNTHNSLSVLVSQSSSHSFERPIDQQDVSYNTENTEQHVTNYSVLQGQTVNETPATSSGEVFGLRNSNYSLQDSWYRDAHEELSDNDYDSDDLDDDQSEFNSSLHENTRNGQIDDGRNKNFKRLREFLEKVEANEPIHAEVSTTHSEIMLAVIKYSLTYNLCQSGIADLFKLISSIIGINSLPDSRYLVDKMFNSHTNVNYHAICPECKQYVKKFNKNDREVTCLNENCKKKFALKDPLYNDFFTIIDIENDIANAIQMNEEHYKEVVLNRQRNRYYIEDFSNSVLYKQFIESLPEQEKNSCITLTFNTDGSPVFENSKCSIWPIQIIVNELPYDVRTKNPIVCGLWFGKDKPNMNIFLTQFVDAMKKLSIDGIKYKCNDTMKCIKAYTVCACVDSVARAPMQGMVQFNGYYGCGWCKHPGVYVHTNSGGSVKYVLLDDVSHERTELEMLQYMKESLTSRNAVFGVKNPTPLINLKGFNVVRSFVPDTMHNISLGVVAQFLKYWIDSSNLPYSLSNDDIKQMDEMLLNTKVPSKIARLTRSLRDRSWWKAREYENWCMYYCLPILSCFPHMSSYADHFSLLVNAFYTLSKDKISQIEVNVAHDMLLKFVAETELYYGRSAMTYNVHQLTHVAQSVIDWGPLWCHSGFCFETGIGKLVRKIQAAKGVVHQLCRILNMQQAESILKEYVEIIPFSNLQRFISYLEKKETKKTFKISNARYFGPYKKVDIIWIEQLQLSNGSRMYRRMVKDKCLYTSYKNRTIRSNNTFAVTKEYEYVRLVDFLVDEHSRKEYVLCNSITTEDMFNTVTNIKRILNVSNHVKAVETNEIDRICVVVKTNDFDYICRIPNFHCY